MTKTNVRLLGSLVLALAWSGAACGGSGSGTPTSASSGGTPTSSSTGAGGGTGGGGINLTGSGGGGGSTGGGTTSTASGSGTGTSSSGTIASSSGTGTSSSSGTGTSSSSSTTTSSSGSTSSSSGGTGGEAPDAGADASDAGCASPVDCPPAASACVTVTCTSGVCGTDFVAAGTPTATQTEGDCHTNECDGAGNVTDAVDDTDLPTSSNPCIGAVCTSGVPSNPPAPSGTACGAGLVCNATGMCVGCVNAIDCPGADTDCQTRTCTSSMCGFSFAPAGKQTSAQTPGDCHTNECDGAGHVTSVVDNTDIPVDTNQCTTATCTAGTPSTPPVAAGALCTQSGGALCNGAGACVQCLVATDCAGSDTECQQRTCLVGACGVSDTAAGTVTSAQTAGDCHTNECDGGGNVVNVVDDTDVPSSSNQCAPGACNAGTPSTPDAAQGTPCTQSGGFECDGAGTCVQCLVGSDCPGSDTECQTRTCTTGTCGVSDAASGTVTSAQTPGDCHTNECDGGGNVVSVVDDTDVPSSSNQCAPGVCNAGTPSTGSAAKGTACTQTGGALCDGAGACTQTFTVVRIGAVGGGTPAATTTAVFLDTYYPLAGSSAVSTVALPTAIAGSNHPLTLSGTATSEGGITRSTDGHTLSLAGYAAGTGVATTGTTRVVGRVGATGTVDTSTTLAATAFSGSNVRGAASVDGTSFWVSGTSSSTGGGVWYVPFGAAAGGTQVEGTPNNVRRVEIFGAQLYADSGSAGFTAPFTVGVGLPTATGATVTVLSGVTSTGANPYDFVLFDLDAGVPGLDTLFIADDSAGVQRWTLSGTTWTQDTTFTVLTSACLGLTGWATDTGVTLIATTQAGTVQSIVVPTTGAPTATVIATEATNTAFRSVALAPH